jgi:hypothetical protein
MRSSSVWLVLSTADDQDSGRWGLADAFMTLSLRLTGSMERTKKNRRGSGGLLEVLRALSVLLSP